MERQWSLRAGLAALLCAAITIGGFLFGGKGGPVLLRIERIERIPEGDYQKEAVFPDWKGYVDDTLAMNGMLSFKGYAGQGALYFSLGEEVKSFDLFVNGRQVDTKAAFPGESYRVDLKEVCVNHFNEVQVRNITPQGGRVRVCIPYPKVIELEKQSRDDLEGIRRESLSFLERLMEEDVAAGFPGAQLAIVRNGKLVYENAWGSLCAYERDGSVKEEREPVTTDTLFDVASVTKMAVTNLCLQRLISRKIVGLDTRVVDILGEEFAGQVVMGSSEEGELTLEECRAWKGELTLRDLLMHQAGFPSSLPFYKANVNVRVGYDGVVTNPYYAGHDGSSRTRENMVRSLCRTPLSYVPRTRREYSDLDYILLGFLIERLTGMDLDTYARETFWEPMGLTHLSYNPLKHGFQKKDCAATELRGNTRDGSVFFPGIRMNTLQGEVHDEVAYYCMGGISGHAGLFANATDLAKLFSLMLTGGYGEKQYFSLSVADMFTAPLCEENANWGLGWYRQGEDGRVWYFGTRAGRDTIGHQGWTGCLAMVDPGDDLVLVYLTNARNTPLTNIHRNTNDFEGGAYTASTLGVVPQILSIGMDLPGEEWEWKSAYQSLALDMVREAWKLLEERLETGRERENQAIFKNLMSKLSLARSLVQEGEEDYSLRLKELTQEIGNRYPEVLAE